MKSALAFALIFASVTAAADTVLFLDMNDSAYEVEAARKAAKDTGRQLVVYPQKNKEAEIQMAALKAEQNKISKAWHACYDVNTDTYTCSMEVREGYEAKSNEIWSQIDSIRKANQFSNEGFTKVLQALKDKKETVSSIVISGHDGTGDFSGANGYVTDRELANLTKNFPETMDSLEAMHLWGCNTTTFSSLVLNWQKSFPNVTLFTGYNGSAPANDKKPGWDYLKGVILKEKQWLNEKDHKKIQKSLSAIPGVNIMTAAICMDGNIITTKSIINIPKTIEKCADITKNAEQFLDIYDCIFRASPDQKTVTAQNIKITGQNKSTSYNNISCEDVPANPGDPVGNPLRALYNEMQWAEACKEVPDFYKSRIANLSRDHLIRMVLHKNVRTNFENLYKKEIQETDKFMDELELNGAKIPADARFSKVSSMTRAQIKEKHDLIRKYINTHEYGKAMRKEDRAKLSAISQMLYAVSSLYSSDSYCIPFDWVEPGATQTSPCSEKKYLGKAYVDLQMKEKEYSSNAYGGYGTAQPLD